MRRLEDNENFRFSNLDFGLEMLWYGRERGPEVERVSRIEVKRVRRVEDNENFRF